MGHINIGHFLERAPSTEGHAHPHPHHLLQALRLHPFGARQEGPCAARCSEHTPWNPVGALHRAQKSREQVGDSGDTGDGGPGKLSTGHQPSSGTLPASSSNVCTDINESPFMSANTTCFLGLWGSGGPARHERKDSWGCRSTSPARTCRRKNGLWLKRRCMGVYREQQGDL